MPSPWACWEFIVLESPRPGVLPQMQPSAGDGEAASLSRSHKPPLLHQELHTQSPHPKFPGDLRELSQGLLLLVLEHNLCKFTSSDVAQNYLFQRHHCVKRWILLEEQAKHLFMKHIYSLLLPRATPQAFSSVSRTCFVSLFIPSWTEDCVSTSWVCQVWYIYSSTGNYKNYLEHIAYNNIQILSDIVINHQRTCFI